MNSSSWAISSTQTLPRISRKKLSLFKFYFTCLWWGGILHMQHRSLNVICKQITKTGIGFCVSSYDKKTTSPARFLSCYFLEKCQALTYFFIFLQQFDNLWQSRSIDITADVNTWNAAFLSMASQIFATEFGRWLRWVLRDKCVTFCKCWQSKKKKKSYSGIENIIRTAIIFPGASLYNKTCQWKDINKGLRQQERS